MGRVKKVKLRRLMSRKIEVREAAFEDARYFYAGYKLGSFDEYLKPPVGMTPDEFKEFLANYAESATQLYTATVEDSHPLCIGHCIVVANRLECHIIWMPWATKRNKVEVVVKFIKEMREAYTIMTVVSEENKDLLFHVRKYGVMRYIGMIKKYFGDEVGHAFQGV